MLELNVGVPFEEVLDEIVDFLALEHSLDDLHNVFGNLATCRLNLVGVAVILVLFEDPFEIYFGPVELKGLAE